ncbi:MAG: DUF3488 domain-containing protein [Candidatus Latescibacteria bacterium]|jgi:protein-glutamine gamma-glutamyltransferase|nr:DUF3488 domain-containing protein [Candidatus Latescibacterota bacterium]
MSEMSLQDQHRLTYNELCQFRWLLGNLLAVISLWTLAYLDVEAEFLIAFTAICVLVSVGWPALPGRLPKFFWSVLVPLFLTVTIIADFFFSQPDIVPPLVRMLLLLVLVRCLQMRRRREDLQLILLCLFMVMLAGVLTLSVTFGLQIMVFTPIAMGMLFLVTLTEPTDRGDDIPEVSYAWETFRWGVFLDRIWKAQDFRLLGITATLFVGVMSVSMLIFVAIPRFQINQAIPFLNLSSTRSISGFSDRIEFGEVVEILEDDSVALRVDVEQQDDTLLNPYWRMVALDEYSNGIFQLSWSARAKQSQMFTQSFLLPMLKGVEAGDIQRWTFYLEGGISKYLPSVGRLRTMRFENRQRFNLNPSLRVVSTRRISSKVLLYQMFGAVMETSIAAVEEDRRLVGSKPIIAPVDSDAERPSVNYPFTTLVVPGGSDNLEVLDRILLEIVKGRVLTPQAFSAAAIEYLQLHHSYSLSVNIPSGSNDIMVRWLDSDQPGHCELFAGAFALLARRAGYPTRIVTGFKGGTWNAYEQYYMVRNKNAHAWCEVYDGDRAWIRADATPGNGAATSMASTTGGGSFLDIDNTLGAYFDSLKILWYRRVVKFDRDQQRELAGGIRSAGAGFVSTVRSRLRSGLDSLKELASNIWSGGPWVLLLRLGILVGFVYGAFRWGPILLFRIAEIRSARTGRIDPVRKKAGAWVRRIERLKPLDQSALQGDVAQWEQIHVDLQCLRYGARSSWRNYRDVFEEARAYRRTRRRL